MAVFYRTIERLGKIKLASLRIWRLEYFGAEKGNSEQVAVVVRTAGRSRKDLEGPERKRGRKPKEQFCAGKVPDTHCSLKC